MKQSELVARDLKWSNQFFINSVWPEVKNSIGGGYIIPLESLVNNDVASKLDVLCGFDYLQVLPDGVRSIASRVQNNKKEIHRGKKYKTFTIRLERQSGGKTEYEKRVAALNSKGGIIYPYYTCHAYFDFGEFSHAGIARTYDVFRALNKNNIRRNPEDGTWFYYVNFWQVKDVMTFGL